MTLTNQKKVLRMYEETDIGSLELFGGGFINFGYWEKVPLHISSRERIDSQKNMYRFVARSLKISPSDELLEIGCGKGTGASLIAKEFNPLRITGIDLSKIQIERAKAINKSILRHLPTRISFIQGAAEKTTFPDESFTKILTIEALQHFKNIKFFIKEAFRILKKNGKLAVATFFSNQPDTELKLKHLIPTFSDKIDAATYVVAFRQMLEKEGFKNIKIKKLGKKVWHGWDSWISQTQYNDHWDRNWYKAYQTGLIDYYIITAKK